MSKICLQKTPTKKLNDMPNKILQIKRGQLMCLASHIFKKATLVAKKARNKLIGAPVRLAKLAAPAVQGADPIAVATLKPFPKELIIRDTTKKLIFCLYPNW